MNFPLLKLELRKNRLSAASVAAAFLVTLPVSRLVASATGMEPAKALEAIMIGWMLLGSPFAAALIASSAGAATASRDAREAEALLPASASRRAAASLGAALLLLAATTAVLVGTAWALGALTPLLSSVNPELNWSKPYWNEPAMAPLFLFTLVDALLACWIMSYVIGHAVGGGLIGGLLTGTTLFVAAIGYGLQLVHGHWGIDMLPAYAALAAAALALKLAAAAKTAAWRERAASSRGAFAFIAFALLFGPAAAWALKDYTYRDLLSRLKPADSPLEYTYQPSTEIFGAPSSPEALSAEGRGVALWNPAAGLYLATSGGVRELIPEMKESVSGFLFNRTMRAGSAARDERGVLWATRFDYSVLELWREDGAGMKLVRREPFNGLPMLERLNRRLWLSQWVTGESKTRYVSVDDFARLGAKAPHEDNLDAARERGAGELGAARIGCVGGCLVRGGRTWRLPGRPQWTGTVLPFFAGGKPVFLVPVAAGGKAWTALFRADGTVEKAWDLHPGSYSSVFGALPDGTLHAFQPGASIGLIDAQGRVSSFSFARLRPKAFEGPRSRPVLVRRSGGRTWVVWNQTLIEATDAGAPVSQAELPEHDHLRALDGGLLLETKAGLLFRAWDGTTRRFEKPR